MWLKRLQAQSLRCFSEIDLSFSPGINVIFGDNGAGKTSILEGIDVLSRGRSFRASKISPIIQSQTDALILFGEVEYANCSTLLAIRSQNSSTELRINREKVNQWSLIARHLPVIDIHPESYLLVNGGPAARRKYLNWGVFHVEPDYAGLWSEYCRTLKQRNSCLKSGDLKQARFWNPLLADKGEQISRHLADYYENLIPYVKNLCAEFCLSSEIGFSYERGWREDAMLADVLEQELEHNAHGYSTQSGPHRSDLKILWGCNRFAHISSRGQQKILTIILKLAQAELLYAFANKSSVYLIDELPAELDQNYQNLAFDVLKKLNSQVIISAVSRQSVADISTDAKWFHVERGRVSAVL